MDTWGLLGQALECSVCLEQLDATSRVLPCQHTFCRKCLIDIINTRKELRCPECRVLVTVPFNSLPPNILLLRILEEIKNVHPITSAETPNLVSETLSISSQIGSQTHIEPFSTFTQYSASDETATQASSSAKLTTNQISIQTSTNPFLEPLSNTSTNISNVHVVPNVNSSGQNNISIASVSDTLSSTSGAVNYSPSLQSPIHNTESQVNIHDQLTNITCPSSLIISTLLSSHSQNNLTRQSLNNSGGDNQISESNISLTTQAVRTSVAPTPVSAPVLKVCDYIRQRRVNVNTQTQREPLLLTSDIINGSALESQFSETNESIPIVSKEEIPLSGVHTCHGTRVSKSLRESHVNTISSQSQVSSCLNIQARALYNYDGKEARDLKFKKGDVINLTKQIDENWYQGELDGHIGIVPSSYVRLLESASSHLPQCKALYDFKMPTDEERNCLMFSKGDSIFMLRRVDENWAEGKLNTHIGIFPLSFVELNEAAKNLIKISTSISPAVPHHRHYNHQIGETSVGSLSTIPTVHSSTHTPIPSVLTPLLAHSSSSQTVQASNSQSESAHLVSQGRLLRDLQNINRLSGIQKSTNVSPSKSSVVSCDMLNRSESGRPHSEIDTNITRSLPSLQLYVALHSYHPRKADELELTKGFLYSVADKCLDGWYKGRCLATDKIGVFPGNYVQLANAETIAAAHYPKSMTASIANYLSEIHGINFLAANNKLKTSTTPRTQFEVGSMGDIRSVSLGVACPPELPPRYLNTSNKIMCSTTERSSSAVDLSPRVSSSSSPVSHQGEKKSTAKDWSGTTNGNAVSLMKKLTTSGKRKTKSPPFLSIDNPVFEEASNKSQHLSEEDKFCNGISKTVKQMPAPLIRERYHCVTPYPANSEYELELQVGDIVYIHKKRDDGWCKGTLQKTGKTGLFPSTFVEPC